jgi:hypothetical protein
MAIILHFVQLFVYLLCSCMTHTLMMVSEAIETFRRRVVYGKTYFIEVHYLVCYACIACIFFKAHIRNTLIAL